MFLSRRTKVLPEDQYHGTTPGAGANQRVRQVSQHEPKQILAGSCPHGDARLKQAISPGSRTPHFRSPGLRGMPHPSQRAAQWPGGEAA